MPSKLTRVLTRLDSTPLEVVSNTYNSRVSTQVNWQPNLTFCGKERRREIVAATRDVETFQKRHRIERQAQVPGNHFLIWSIVFFLFTVEMALNGAIFASGLIEGTN